MIEPISHLLYVGHSSEARNRLAAMLDPPAVERQPAWHSLLLLPDVVPEIGPGEPLPQADLYLLDLAAVGKKRPLTAFTQLQRQAEQTPILILVTPEQQALAGQIIQLGAADYLVWGQFDTHLLQHVVQLLLRITGRRLPLSLVTKNQHLIDSLHQTGTFVKSPLDFDDMLARFLNQLAHIITFDTAFIMFVEGDQGKVVQTGSKQPQLQEFLQNASLTFTISQTPNLHHIVQTGQPLLIPDVHQYEGWVQITEVDYVGSWMGAPIVIHDNIIALLNVAKAEPYFYTEQDLHYLTVFAEQAALVLHNALLYKETRRQFERLTVLHSVALLGTEARHEDELIEKTTQIIGDTLYPDNFGVLLLDEATGQLLVHPSYRVLGQESVLTTISLAHGIVGYVARTGRPYRTGDVTQDPYYVQAENDTLSELCVPLKLGDRVLGVINTESIQANAFSERDEQLLVTLAGQLATALEKARLLAVERARRQEAETLREAVSMLTSTLNLEQVLDQILVQLEQVVAYDSASVLLLQNDHLYLQAGRGFPAEIDVVGQYFLADNELFREVQRTKRPLYLADTSQDPRFKGWGGINYIRGWLSVPLISRGEVIGLLTIDSRNVGAYNELDITLTQSLAGHAAVAIQNAQLYEATRNSAAELRLATEVLRILNADPIFQDAFPAVSTTLKQIAGADTVCLILLNSEDGQDCTLIHDGDNPLSQGETHVRLNHTAIIDRLMAGQPYLSNDLNRQTNPPIDHLFAKAGFVSQASIPLMGKNLLGALTFLWRHKHAPNNSQILLLNQLANASALAIERSRLFIEVNRQAEQLQLLNELGRQISGLLDSQSLSQAVVDFLHALFDFTSASVLLVDESNEYLVLQAIAGLDHEAVLPGVYRLAVGQGLMGRVATTGEPLLVNDTRAHPDFLSWPYTRVLSALVLPLWAGDRVLGVLNMDSDHLDAFNENDLVMFTLVADQLAVTLEKARLFEETRRRTAELEAVGQISTMLRRANTVDEMLPLILDHCLTIVAAQLGSIFLIEPGISDLVARWCVPSEPVLLQRRYKADQGIAGYVVTTGEIYITNDLMNDPLTYILPEEMPFLSELQSTIGLPLRAQGRIVGVILISLAERHTYSQVEVRLLTAISDIAGSALDRALVLETLEQRVADRTHELAEANEQLQALDKLKSKFISDMSHELRTPITNLGLYVDLLRQGRPEKQAYYLDVLRKQISRLGQLMEDILSLSRLEMSRDPISFTRVDFNQLIKQNIEALQVRLEAADLHLVHDLEPDLPPVYGEPNQLGQIVSNLLSNAINYAPQGEVLVRTFRAEPDTICFEVKDNGVGIAEEEQPLIFQRFYRGQQMGQSNVPGTGLGLAIVQEVVSLHGGRMEFESRLNEGSTFRVWLPAGNVETAVINGDYHEQATTLV